MAASFSSLTAALEIGLRQCVECIYIDKKNQMIQFMKCLQLFQVLNVCSCVFQLYIALPTGAFFEKLHDDSNPGSDCLLVVDSGHYTSNLD